MCSLSEFYISLNADSHTEEVQKNQIVHHIFLLPVTPISEYCTAPNELTSYLQVSKIMEKFIQTFLSRI